MATFEYKDKHFYIDDRLNRDLIKKVYPDLMKNDKDNVFLVDGAEGSGKSKFADILAAHAALHMNADYDINSVCLSPQEFRDRIQNCKNRSIVTYDEAHRGMGSRRALSEINNILIDLMMEMRQKNLFVIIIMPTFFLLDKYAALFRTKGLFHIYERNRKRGYWVFFNEKNKLKLYILGKKLLNYNVMKYPGYRGKFFNQYSMDENEYRAKKLKVFKEKPSITRSEKYMEQRNIVIGILYDNLGVNKTELTKILKENGIPLKREMVTAIILSKKREKDGKDSESQGISMEIDGNVAENADKVGNGDDINHHYTTKEEENDDFDGGEESFDEKEAENEGM